MNKNQQLALGAAVLLGIVTTAFTIYKKTQQDGNAGDKEPVVPAQKPEEEKKEEEEIVVADDPNWEGFSDPDYGTNHYLTKAEAQSRSTLVSEVSYTLALGLVKGGKTFHGKVTIDWSQSRIAADFVDGVDNKECLFIDYKGKSIKSLIINGTTVPQSTKNLWRNHRIYIPAEYQNKGINRVVIDFESNYVKDCQGFQYFQDEADSTEYIYTELEPDYCHIVFPCFDQPDLKAPHKTCIVAPTDWEVISNSENIGTCGPEPINSEDQDYRAALQRFQIALDSPIVTSFGDQPVMVHEFGRTKSISTYLFCFVAGPFDCLYPSEQRKQELPGVPMRVYCRKSLTNYAEKMKDDWFRISQCSIKYYEEMFDTPYPFDKLDSVFCPDYAMGAMENVGCITYNDDYIQRDEHFTRYKWEYMFNTISHEISHQWFGNLVTMKWWDDLWLNESFANMISYMANDEGAGMEDLTMAWNIFIDEQYWGLAEDQKNTTHPIAATCNSTGDAQDIFDGISYGKGAAFLHQMVFYLGKDLLKEGLKTYFAKYKFKNTELKDFIAELSDAAKRLNLQVDFQEWSDTWLTTSGCATIELEFKKDEASGNFTEFSLVQTPYNKENTPSNRLRVQALNVTALDENMKVIKTVRVETSATSNETRIPEFVGPQGTKIHCFLINHGCHAYGKFGISEMTLKALETGLHKIESSLDRKQIINIMFDMIKSGKIPASRVLYILKKNFEHETAVDILQDTFKSVIPGILGRYLHTEVVEERNAEMFDMTMRIMMSGKFNSNLQAMEVLVNSAISFDRDAINVYKWFVAGKVLDAAGKQVQGTEVNVKSRHTMVRKIVASSKITQEQKKESFAELAKLDSSDMLGRTEKYCEAASPIESQKRQAFMQIFTDTEMTLQHVQEMCRGFRQSSQRDLISSFTDEFFEKIEDCVNDRAWSNTRYIYLFVQPNLCATDAEIQRFTALKDRLEAYTEEQRKEGTMRLINWAKDSIQELEEKRQGRVLSKTWEDAQKANL